MLHFLLQRYEFGSVAAVAVSDGVFKMWVLLNSMFQRYENGSSAAVPVVLDGVSKNVNFFFGKSPASALCVR